MLQSGEQCCASQLLKVQAPALEPAPELALAPAPEPAPDAQDSVGHGSTSELEYPSFSHCPIGGSGPLALREPGQRDALLSRGWASGGCEAPSKAL